MLTVLNYAGVCRSRLAPPSTSFGGHLSSLRYLYDITCVCGCTDISRIQTAKNQGSDSNPCFKPSYTVCQSVGIHQYVQSTAVRRRKLGHYVVPFSSLPPCARHAQAASRTSASWVHRAYAQLRLFLTRANPTGSSPSVLLGRLAGSPELLILHGNNSVRQEATTSLSNWHELPVP